MITTNTSDLPSDSPEQEELAYLRDFRKHMFRFLHILCNYDIRTPAICIRSYTDLMLRFPDFNQHPERNLKVIYRASQEIFDVINTVIAMTYFERGPGEVQEFQSGSEVDLKVIFDRHISYARKCIEDDNESFRSDRENANNNPNVIIGHDIIATNLVVNIPDHLPKAYGDERVIDQIVECLTKLAVRQPLKYEVQFESQFDGKHIITTIGWIGTGRKEHLLDAFHQFASAQTGFAFYDDAFSLYLCWQIAQLQGGQLHFEIRDQATHLLSFSLPSTAQQALAPDAA